MDNESKDLQPVPQTKHINLFFEDMPVRLLQDENEELWFVARDVCDILELEHITNALDSLDDDELTVFKLQSGNQMREMKLISEPGFYSLVGKSRKPQAKAFKRWVNHEVLPSIRKTGSYGLAPALPAELLAEVRATRTLMQGMAKELVNIRMSFYRGGTVSSFSYLCCESASQDVAIAKDYLYGIYVEEYCQILGYQPRSKADFYSQIYRAVSSSGASTITVNGRRIPAVRGFRLLPNYRAIIDDERLAAAARAAAELASRREHYYAVQRVLDERKAWAAGNDEAQP